ncbi:hypothetical protein IM697_00230 [Streptomyces ferrugineus]|uniref:Uncharacterized protein n=1 Tax=Streptomyces ferrugineus TaxID=1413221 RepID=A0A7M2SMK0_9ACTN|nr:hypothetical protein [Streptomyces ferrugineus]QOV36945.1 hypothetical protein IM697_00230 [Streptomyces ferrugineus]
MANLREQVDMTNATTSRDPGFKMTLRVYTVDRYGAVTEERGTVGILYGTEPQPLMPPTQPCACPSCRTERSAETR